MKLFYSLSILYYSTCFLPHITAYLLKQRVMEVTIPDDAEPDGFYNKFDLKDFRMGHLNGQGYWTTSSKGSYEIDKQGLTITHSDGRGALLHRPFNEGVITLKIKNGSSFFIGYQYQLNQSQRFACWSADGKNITLGFAKGVEKIDTVAFKSSVLPAAIQNSKDFFYLRIAIGPVHKNAQQKVWVWPAKEGAKKDYNLQDKDKLLLQHNFDSTIHSQQEGYIQLANPWGTAIIRDVRITDYNNADNYLTKKALFIGNWFNTLQGSRPSPAALMSFTSGSEIRFKVKNTSSTTISFFISELEKKPYQPYIDVQFRDITLASQWSSWHRYQIPWVRAPNNADVKIGQGLQKNHQYEFRCTIDIYNGDSCWMYGIGAIVKDIQGDPGATMIPSDNKGQPVIMALGNSITAGVRQYLIRPGAIDQPSNLLSYNSYFHIACDSLGAIPYNNAFGGTGINKEWKPGGTPSALTTLRYFKQGRPRKSISPSVILINEGTNDNIKDTASFVKGYIELIDQLQAFYPKAAIILMIPFCQKFKEPIREIGAARHFKIIETENWKLSYVDGVHPDSLSHRKAGDNLFHWLKNNDALNYKKAILSR